MTWLAKEVGYSWISDPESSPPREEVANTIRPLGV